MVMRCVDEGIDFHFQLEKQHRSILETIKKNGKIVELNKGDSAEKTWRKKETKTTRR